MLLKLIAGLNDRDNRFEAAKNLAGYFGCSYLFVFIIDQEIGVLLPAPGFPQTLPDGCAWQSFINNCPNDGCYSGSLPFPEKQMVLPAIGISGPENSIIILLGGNPSAGEVAPLKTISPILISLFTQESIHSAVKTKVAFAEKTVAKAEKLASTIDVMRTHLKDALIQKEKDKKAIEDLMEKKDEFMNVASHELKTPITTLKAYLQVLQKMVPATALSSAGDFINKANKQIKKLTDLVDDLLDVNKIQAGRMVYQFSDINLVTLIEEIVEQTQMTTLTHRIVLQNNSSVIISGERNRLEQVLGNFLSNAIKYSPNASEVVVKSELTNKEVKVSVRDFGIGIPLDEQEHIFDRFYRVNESSRKFSGLGLGLFISAEIIKKHGGTIGVESNGAGSEFYFTMPLVKVVD
ncbi:MAG: chemotaxis protein [Mucilaginibacter sp.]|uniref:sensor histidine kinase n=1 Tax=Mucilaginibacter sp. TaxID=1882438 RepID=UPI0026257EEA|nr:HAMP domain-containing sensor histidine kinase [Mucilaginibacter sp.]MDB5005314.1 chemotaxis protein [Mucilaginibacter sp.]